ncbi:hypothetical protein AUEXF2481DRAFT_462261 [Aureobasidium subglaciale EXF-2481]|uniref:Uncharacterized protein n=1 Tax=Aureobasidium subglaciale (strain EXF-2481) TaxID=1043005 RepID=A0A074Y1G6_AURSE|nr:uncharacterized protein AUEXF2481DRAFT_462261 [Aureobasidium subglaciale EXF-2481]KEQ91570.1 hypothetical protein AUEXF2481DRAFT_462261 [Aureobasidium subglaciale EXF-2481]
MADPDSIMVDAQPAPQLRHYTIPDALEPPCKWDARTNLPVIERWADVRKNLTARIHPDYTGFDVREINHADPTGMGRRHIHDWPASFPLGPPSEAPDYHPILEKYGLKILNRAGFINNNLWKEDAIVGPSGVLAFAPFRNPGVDEDEMLHPILRRDKPMGFDGTFITSSYSYIGRSKDISLLLRAWHALRLDEVFGRPLQ